jgi:hypothetical protein
MDSGIRMIPFSRVGKGFEEIRKNTKTGLRKSGISRSSSSRLRVSKEETPKETLRRFERINFL